MGHTLREIAMKWIVLVALAALSLPSFAQSESDALTRCIADSTTGKDRKDLARWLFIAMAAHPDMKSISNVPPAVAEEATRTAGSMFTRLLADSCPQQIKAAIRAGGPMAIQGAFQVLGQLAMQELMTDKDVMSAMSMLDRYLDKQKLATLDR